MKTLQRWKLEFYCIFSIGHWRPFFFIFQTNIAQTFLLRTFQIEKIFSIFKIHTETISNLIFQS